MVNAALVAMELHGLLPALETPYYTENYEGFYHLVAMRGEKQGPPPGGVGMVAVGEKRPERIIRRCARHGIAHLGVERAQRPEGRVRSTSSQRR